MEWNRAETPLLEDAEGDVLTMLDSCFASNIQKGSTEQTGKNSFTSILTEELQELLKKHRGRKFATVELVQRINLRRRKRPSMLWDRLNRHDHHICLAPLNTKDLEERQISFQNMRENASLTLRIALKEERLTSVQIEGLAQRLPKAFRKSQVEPLQIHWMGLCRHPQRSVSMKGVASIAKAAYRFMSMSNKRDKNSIEEVSPTSTTPSITLKRTQDSLDSLESPDSKRRMSEASADMEI